MSFHITNDVSVAIILGIIGVLCFYSSIDGQFVFDDAEAVINNRDLQLQNPIEDVFRHDFWGNYILNNASHKSYRPLTVLSFRFHVWWNNGKLVPFDFHLFNLLLHGLATSLSYPVFGKLFHLKKLWGSKAFLSALLFAVHPIHSETVAGIVGRADLLCAIFSFLSFLIYCKSIKCFSPVKNILITSLCGAVAGIAMLCKEQGITVIAFSLTVFVVVVVFLIQRLVTDVSVAIILGIIGVLCFYSSIDGQFVFDDAEAVINNRDLQLQNPIEDVFRHDFWGNYILNNASHKSYRPLTVLSFRFHVWWNNGKLVPFDFHLFNLLLHGLATSLSYPVFGKLFHLKKLWGSKAFLSALLFAVHPIHSETVAGIVGRADLLCAIFSFLSFLIYCKSIKCFSPVKNILITSLCGAVAGIAMLCKEQGITVIGICSAYDILVINGVHPMDILPVQVIKPYVCPDQSGKVPSFQKPCWSFICFAKKYQLLLVRHIVLLLAGSLLLYYRCWVMNFTSPIFRPIDNPHSFAEHFIERVLNYNYIYALNAWLLICPEWLCFDWSMGCVPLITLENVFNDFRILVVLLFWLIFALLIVTNLKRPSTIKQREVLLAVSCIIVPFSVASNILFRVGFVIAERVLYLPSIGYCMLIVIGIHHLLSCIKWNNIIHGFVLFLVIINALRCHHRSLDWRSEEQLFTKGLRVCPLNAKIHYNFAKTAENTTVAIKHYRRAIELYPDYEQAMNNLANVLRESGNASESEALLRKAISIRPDFAAAWMNLGIVLATMQRYDDALECYNYALAYRKNYPDCYYNLGNLFLSQKMYNEAFIAWKQATNQKPTHSVAWNNMIVMLDSMGEFDKAQSLATEALTILPNDSALHFNLANTLGKKGYYENAEQHFLKAIKLKENQALYHTNLGVLYHRWKKYGLAEAEYKKALKLNPDLKNVEQNLKTVQKFLKME